MNLKDKTVVFIDNGLFISFCRKVAPEFGKAYYHKPFQSAFVRTNDLAPGQGFPEFEWLEQPQEIEDEIDLWVFLDLYNSGWQERLRAQGKRVWGAGNGEEMELCRWDFKQALKKLGLPVQHCEHLFGMSALRKYLKGKKDTVFVKTSYVRGDFETFKCQDYDIVEPKLVDLEHVLGVKAEKYEFIVEDEIPDACEVGFDGFVIDGQFPHIAMQAYELKDIGMIGAVKEYEKLSEPVKLINKKLSSTFQNYKYRGFFCSEIRYTNKKESFLIDPCTRLGTPSNELLQILFSNWGQTLWDGAEGKLTTPKKEANFGCLVMLQSEFATTDWYSVSYPREIDDSVKLRFHVRQGKKDYIVPQIIGIPDFGCVVGKGDTLNSAIKDCKDKASKVKGYQLQVNLDAIEKGLEVIQQGEDFGIKF